MNRGVMERQMFKNGGAAGFPDLSGDGKVTQKDILMGRGVEMKDGGPVRMQEGGATPLMAPQPAQATVMPPAAMTSQMAAAPMAAQSMTDQPLPAEMAGNEMDQAVVEEMLSTLAPAAGDPEQAQDFEQMMNMVRGTEAPIEERRMELADLVGEEDAAQTPDSVLALLQPVMLIAAAEQQELAAGPQVDQGIGGLAEQAMQQPVEGDMAGGIMSMMGG